MEASKNSTTTQETSQDTSSQPTNNIQDVPYKKVIEDEFIDMSFIQSLTAVPLTEDNGVTKYIDSNSTQKQDISDQNGVSAKEETKPKYRARCRILFEGRTENGELVEKERQRKQLKAFKLMEDNMIKGIHYATASLNKGETGWFRFTPEYHFGPQGVQDLVAPNAILYYKIELVDFTNEKGTLANDDYDGRIAIFNECREKGNEAFQKKEYERALKEYKIGVNITKNLPKELLSKITEEQSNVIKDLKLKLANNAAMACIKLNKYQEGLQFINIVLSVDGKNAKALFRKGQCEMELGNLEQARVSFEESINAGNPEKNECLRNIHLCQRTRKTKAKDEGQVYKQIFERMAAEEEKELKEKKLQEKIERKKEREKLKNEGEDKGKEIPKNTVNVNQLLEGTVIDSQTTDFAQIQISNDLDLSQKQSEGVKS